MKIEILVKSDSRRESVEKRPDGSFKVAMNAPPVEGRANERLIEVLAGFFQVPKSALTIVGGSKERRKSVEIGRFYRQPIGERNNQRNEKK